MMSCATEYWNALIQWTLRTLDALYDAFTRRLRVPGRLAYVISDVRPHCAVSWVLDGRCLEKLRRYFR